MPPKNVVGEKVRQLRLAKGWSQDTLAAKCNLAGWDLSRGTLSKIEARLRLVTDSEAFALAKVLGVDIAALYPTDKKKAMAAVRNPQ